MKVVRPEQIRLLMKKYILISSLLLVLSTSSLTHAQEMIILEDDEDEAPTEAIELDTSKRGITKRHIWINYGKATE